MTQALLWPRAAGASHPATTSLPLKALSAAIVALFALDNILLLSFLGLSPLPVTALAITLPPLLALFTYRMVPGHSRISLQTIAVSIAVAGLLLLLGGEGRLFYAAADWQVRDAVLADMGNHRWPFDYLLDGRSQILRAPLGMYLIPALVGGASQLGRDWTLLAQNSLLLGLIFAVGSTLFDGRRAKLVALAIFVAFSGLDILGNSIRQVTVGEARWDNIEDWANGYQYSAHLTQLFWVPQHAIAGWTVALFYLLWRRNLVPLGVFAASLPLVALWSPLILFGAIPFAIAGGVGALRSCNWHGRDVLLCAFAAGLAIPALIYSSIDAGTVGSGLKPPTALIYVLLMLFEVLPFLLPVLHDRDNAVDRTTILITTACLFLMPSWTIGQFNDFQTRASIMPLALLAIAFADWGTRLTQKRAKAGFFAIVALGSVTGGIGLLNVFRFAASPAPLCSVPAVWDHQIGLSASHASYFAARAAFPWKITPLDRISAVHSDQCWDRPWRSPA